MIEFKKFYETLQCVHGFSDVAGPNMAFDMERDFGGAGKLSVSSVDTSIGFSIIWHTQDEVGEAIAIPMLTTSDEEAILRVVKANTELLYVLKRARVLSDATKVKS